MVRRRRKAAACRRRDAPSARSKAHGGHLPWNYRSLSGVGTSPKRSPRMSVSREYTTSLWMDTEVAPAASSLARDERAGTVIVGSGIAGLSTAYELAKRGQDVVV